MAKINSDYPIGSSKEYISNVKGLFNYSIDSRNAMLMNNPLERRYRDNYEGYSMVDAPDIGEKYVLPNPKKKQKSFLDKVGGLVGYTCDEGYLETNNYKVISRFEEVEKHQGWLRFNIPYLYNVDLHVDINREGFDYSFLDRLFYYYTQEREMNLYGNDATYREFNPMRHVVNQYNPTQTYVTPKSTNEWYSTNEETFYPDGKSVDEPSYSEDGEGFVKGTASNLSLNTRMHNLYDERTENDNRNKLNRGKGDESDNRPSNDIIFDLNATVSNPNSLISKTNNLFRQGKINSMINRFYLPNQGLSEIQTAVHSKYGVSRGRNLLKAKDTTESNGYENPYCRVWTSHYQYSKYKNAIRPFIEDGSIVTPDSFDEKFGKGFRPFKENRTMSSIDGSNGLPMIAPKTDEDVKKCMFSIENLAWKDIHFDTEVKDRGAGKEKRGFDNVLSKEQQGPNGGRIMWFPPYNLKFTENVGVNWNGNSFIGRGEQIYTYVNTDRSGTLDFTLLIDHPSILDRYSVNKDVPTIENDEEILRFFAGCAPLPIDDKVTITKTEIKERPMPVEPSVDPKPEEVIDDLHMRLYAFFPNNFSGKDYVDEDPNKAVTYLLLGGKNGNGYEGGNGSSTSPIDGCIGIDVKTSKNKNGDINTWYYEVDNFKKDEVLKTKTVYDGNTNYKDTACFGLNNAKLIDILTGNTAYTKKAKEILRIEEDKSQEEISNMIIPFSDIDMIRSYFSIVASDGQNCDVLANPESVKIRCVGFASKHGDQIPNGNYTLAYNRAKLLQEFLIKESKFDREWFAEPTVEGFNVKVGNDSVSSIEAKLGRHAAAFIDVTYKYMKQPEVQNTKENSSVSVENKAYQLSLDAAKELMKNESVYNALGYKKLDTSSIDENARKSILATAKTLKPIGDKIVTTTVTEEVKEPEYDTEYRYFKRVSMEDDVVRSMITNKVKYFDPVYHSITPEGFNSRLTFLHQCTRQGPTVAATEGGAVGAGNLAFGRPPVCVLRIGDFYNTRIIIDSVSINYDTGGGIQWDMNTEGIGLQPMFANVTIGFKFLGGSDLSGPISRLQNAVSYNFYANTSVYDRHADYRNSFVTPDGEDNGLNMWEAGFNTEEGTTKTLNTDDLPKNNS